MNYRSVLTVTNSIKTQEGTLEIRRAFPSPGLDFQDPFLLFDHMGPMQVRPGEKKGVSTHPHRGFETVTYIFEGEMHHEDSAGNSGDIKPGDIQWMTAGSGIVHSEFPSEALSKTGGTMHGIQLWVNLAAEKKMIPPAYQGITSDQFPVIKIEHIGSLKVLGGSYQGQESPISIQSPLAYYHVHLNAAQKIEISLPQDWMSLAYSVNGSFEAAGTHTINEAQTCRFKKDGDSIKLTNLKDKAIDIMVLAGEEIKEPIAAYGPFVMNTKEEIEQAIEDYQAGKFA